MARSTVLIVTPEQTRSLEVDTRLLAWLRPLLLGLGASTALLAAGLVGLGAQHLTSRADSQQALDERRQEIDALRREVADLKNFTSAEINAKLAALQKSEQMIGDLQTYLQARGVNVKPVSVAPPRGQPNPAAGGPALQAHVGKPVPYTGSFARDAGNLLEVLQSVPLDADRLRHRAGDLARVRRERGLVGTMPAQTRERRADCRRDARTRGLDGLLARLGGRLPGEPAAAHLRHREQQESGVGLAQAAGAERVGPLLETVAQVRGDAGQVRRHQRLDPQLLEQLEHPALQRALGPQPTVQRLVGVQQPQRQPVGHAAEGARVLCVAGMEVRSEVGQAALAPVQSSAAEVQRGLAGECSDRGRAQRLQPLAPPAQRLVAGIGRRSSRAHAAPGSTPKQRW